MHVSILARKKEREKADDARALDSRHKLMKCWGHSCLISVTVCVCVCRHKVLTQQVSFSFSSLFFSSAAMHDAQWGWPSGPPVYRYDVNLSSRCALNHLSHYRHTRPHPTAHVYPKRRYQPSTTDAKKSLETQATGLVIHLIVSFPFL